MGEINPQIEKPPKMNGIDIRNRSTTIRNFTQNGQLRSEKIFTYQLVANAEGEAVIGSSAVNYREPSDEEKSFLTTEPVIIQVQPRVVPFSERLLSILNHIVFKIFLFFAILSMIGFVTYCRIKRSKLNKTQEDSAESIDPVQECIDRAKRYRMEGNWSNYTRSLEQAVRHAFLDRYPGKQYDRLIHYAELLSSEQQKLLQRFTENCEQIKYAPISPSKDDLDRMQDDVIRLIDRKEAIHDA